MSGANGSRYAGRWVSASAPVLRPWKDPSAATMPVRPVRRASLIAASFASVPELHRKTREPSGAPATLYPSDAFARELRERATPPPPR